MRFRLCSINPDARAGNDSVAPQRLLICPVIRPLSGRPQFLCLSIRSYLGNKDFPLKARRLRAERRPREILIEQDKNENRSVSMVLGIDPIALSFYHSLSVYSPSVGEIKHQQASSCSYRCCRLT